MNAKQMIFVGGAVGMILAFIGEGLFPKFFDRNEPFDFSSESSTPRQSSDSKPLEGSLVVEEGNQLTIETQDDANAEELVDSKASSKTLSPAEPKLILSGKWKESETRNYYQEVYDTSAKYRYIMKQEIFETSSLDSSVSNSVGVRKFVADHLVVKVKEGWDAERVDANIAEFGYEVRKKMKSEGLYLISFPLMTHDSWNKAAETLRGLDFVNSVVPDIYGKAF